MIKEINHELKEMLDIAATMIKESKEIFREMWDDAIITRNEINVELKEMWDVAVPLIKEFKEISREMWDDVIYMIKS